MTRPAAHAFPDSTSFAIASGIADLRVGEGHDLPGIGGIGEDLLVAGHRGIENHLADRRARHADRLPPEQACRLLEQVAPVPTDSASSHP